MIEGKRFMTWWAVVILLITPCVAVFAAGEYTEPGYIDRVLYPEGYSILSSEHVMYPVDVSDWPVKIDAHHQLFVDDYLIADMVDLTRQYHAVVKCPENPVLKADQPWEFQAVGPCRVMYDPATKTFRMWYGAVIPSQVGGQSIRRYSTLYAESKDGVHWTKPNLGLSEHNGSSHNNILIYPGYLRILHISEDRPADQRYIALISHKPPADDVEREGIFLYTSPDGLHWTGHLDQCIVPHLTKVTMPQDGIGDTTIFRYDPLLGRFVCDCKFLIPDDRFGRLRCRGMAESDDLIHWTRPRVILYPDERDAPDSQIYAQISFVYESMWLGSVRVMHTERTGWKQTDVEFSYSRDGRHWSRPPLRQPFLELGVPDGWEPDYSSVINQEPLLIDDELWFYYSGSRNPARDGQPKGSEWSRAVGLAKLRRDGFASLNAGNVPGSVVTRPLTFQGKSLFINAQVAEDGYVKAAVLSRKSEPLPGYGLEDSIPLTGDTIRGRIRWQIAKTLESSRALTDHYRLKFELTNAGLYAFWIE